MSDRERFALLVEELIARVESELVDPDWVMKRFTKKMRDSDRTVYEVPFLALQKGPVRLSLDPIGYDIPGAEAALDLYLMPTYDPLATICNEDGRWFIYSDFLPESESERYAGDGRRASLSREMLIHVMEVIARDAVPSN